ncbi:hypothetical protein GCM10009642_22650 [Nocardiopsis metallicus]
MPDGRFREETESGAGQAPQARRTAGEGGSASLPPKRASSWTGTSSRPETPTRELPGWTRASGLDEVPDLPEECAPEGEFVTINQGSLKKGPYGEDSP